MPNTEIPSYREGKHRLKSIRKMLFFIVFVQTVVTAVAALVNSFLDNPAPVYLQLLIIELLAYFLPICLYARENRLLKAVEARERFGLKKFDKRIVPFIILSGFGCQFAMVVLNLPMSFLPLGSDGYIPVGFLDLIGAIIVIGIIPAIFEEFILRGIVYGVMAEFNDKAALIFTTVMFALLHASPAGIPGYIFLGIMLVLILRRTGSLYACMLFHLTNNITAVFLLYFNAQLFYNPVTTLWLFVAGLTGLLLGYMGVSVFTKPKKPVRLIKTKELLGQSFVNLPVLLCIIFLICVMIGQLIS